MHIPLSLLVTGPGGASLLERGKISLSKQQSQDKWMFDPHTLAQQATYTLCCSLHDNVDPRHLTTNGKGTPAVASLSITIVTRGGCFSFYI